MLKTFDPAGERDLVFVPVGINYDRVLEDRTLLLKLDSSGPRRGIVYASRVTLGFAARQVWSMLLGSWHKFGYACVNFGKPVSMREYVRARSLDFRALGDEERRLRVTELGQHLMAQIGAVVPVLPVSLVATVLLQSRGRPLSELELKAAVHELMIRLERAGAHVYIPRADHDYAITVGLRMLILRRLVTERDGLYAPILTSSGC
jgi:glycerol-3-phosphate O-acyltransferase